MFLKAENFPADVRQNKLVLHELIDLLTTEIQTRSPNGAAFDFRFVLPMAQWMCEQGGYNTAPLGNNPGNVMGKGDAGSFQRPDNKEWINGAYVPRPYANFASYSSMKLATKLKFDHLSSKWLMAYLAVLYGGSVESYVSGLYPGRGRDYATAPKSSYASGMRVRVGQLLGHLRLSLEDDRKELEARVFGLAPGTRLFAGRLFDPLGLSKLVDCQGLRGMVGGPPLDHTNDTEMNRNARAVIDAQLSALDEVVKRFRQGKGVPV